MKQEMSDNKVLKKELKDVTPYKDSDGKKKEQVADMFNNIAGKYDFLNHFLSMNIDKVWRRKAINKLKDIKPQVILDVATGTGDFAISSYKILKPKQIEGIDISSGMIEVGFRKIYERDMQNVICLQEGDSENIPFEDNTFDAVTVAFGVRNFENLNKGLAEMFRVAKENAKVVILEFSVPQAFPVKQLYGFYFSKILPFFGKIVSRHSTAYSYLPESVGAFPDKKKFVSLLTEIGYKQAKAHSLFFGVAQIYTGIK